MNVIVLPPDAICPECGMRVGPDQIHTREECIVAQVMEYEETIGWMMTEEVGLSVYNPRCVRCVKLIK